MKAKYLLSVFLGLIFLVSNKLPAQYRQDVAHLIQSKVFESERSIKVFLPKNTLPIRRLIRPSSKALRLHIRRPIAFPL